MPGHPPCHLCGGALSERPDFASLWRVSSDCRPCPPGGRVGVCVVCGAVQKPPDANWRLDTERIYATYDIYHQSGGVEQSTFDPVSGQPQTRSSRLADFLHAWPDLPSSGRLLDVGCGNGAMLRAASSRMPGWKLSGLDLSDRYRDTVLRIPGVEAFYSVDLNTVSDRFEVVTLVHALEHIVNPARFLRDSVAPRLAADGAVFIEVPDVSQNPYDLLVADHATHFDSRTLEETVTAGGFEVLASSRDWIPKELTLLARPARSAEVLTISRGDGARALGWIDQLLDTRRVIVEIVRKANQAIPFGVFGTSIAATWIASELGDAVQFFVDEDPARGPRPFMGRPVLRPAEVEPGASVLVMLAPVVAATVVGRLSGAFPNVNWWPPSKGD